MSRFAIVGIACIAAISLATAAGGQVIITEIMYNPASSEKYPNDVEWVEIYNAGGEAVDVGGWYLDDEDGRAGGLPKETTLAPGQAIVLVPTDQTEADFRKAWGDEVKVYPLADWGLPGKFNLSNDCSAEDEILTLRKMDGQMVDQVNYDDEGDWPGDVPDGPSIYLLPGKMTADANDEGSNWAASVAGTDGAGTNRITEDFNKVDAGSPGVVIAGPSRAE